MATALALLTVAMAFAMVSGPPEADAAEEEEIYYYKEYDIADYGNEDYLVLLGTKHYTTSMLQGYTNVYIVSNGNPTSLAGALAGCTTIEKAVVSTDIHVLGNEFFKGCTSLRTVNAHGLTHIGDSAFENTAVSHIGVDSDLKSIGKNAFKGCDRLTDFDLHRTLVSSIGAGAFQDSAIRLADLRNVTDLHATAFSGSDLTLQVVRPGQANAVPGVDRLYLDAERDYFNDISISNGSVHITMNSTRFMDIYDEAGNEVEYRISRSGSENVHIFTAVEGTDYSIDRRNPTISFPDDIGLEDVTLEDNVGTYKLPELRLGDLTLQHWEVEGLEGEFTQITTTELSTLKGEVTMVPVFDSAILYMEHSAVSGYTDVSDLLTTTTFTYGDGYPELGDVYGYRFIGWTVDGVDYEPGQTIETFTEHTAYSRWEPTITHTLTYSDGHGGTVASSEIGYGQSATPDSSLTADGVGAELFLGWSLDGETVLGEDELVTMEDDVVLVPVFGERELLTVEYVVDGEGWDSAECYRGRTLTVDADEPSSEMIFDHWSGSDGKEYRTGEMHVLEESLVLTAVWRDRNAYTLAFVDPEGETVTGYKVEGIPYEITLSGAGSENGVFDHWADAEGNEYAVGDVITDEGSMTLTAVYRERQTFEITFTDGGEEVLADECPEGEAYTVTLEDPVSDDRIFVGWTDPSGKPYVKGDRIEPTGDLTLTAQWRDPNEFTVTFMDGTEVAGVLTGMEGSTVTVDVRDPAREGKVFLCWTDGDGNGYSNGDRLTLTGNVVLESSWRDALTFTVTFTDGGRTLGTLEGMEGTEIVLTVDDPVSYDRVFLGWTDGESSYESGGRIMMTSDIVLEAEWRDAVFHTVTLSSQGKVFDTAEVREGGTLTLETPGERDGYEFVGWSTSDDGTAEYTAGQTLDVDTDLMLYAVWRGVTTTPPTGGDDTDDEGGQEPEVPSGPSDPSGSDDDPPTGWDRPTDPGGKPAKDPDATDPETPGTGDGDDEGPEETDPDATDPEVPGGEVSEDDAPDEEEDDGNGTVTGNDGDGGGLATPATMAAAVCAVTAVVVVLFMILRRS